MGRPALTAEAWAGDYVGLPWLRGGRDRAGLDCWGLVRLVLRERAGVEVPAFAGVDIGTPLEALRTVEAQAAVPEWARVDEPRTLDVALLRAIIATAGGKRPAHVHCAVIVGWPWMLHTEAGKEACLERLDDPGMAWRRPLIFRHQRLAVRADGG